MEENITGLEESELDRADNREQLEKKTKSHMIEFRTKMSEFELNNMIGEVERLKMVIDILLDSLREQKRVIRNSAITQ